MSKEGNKKEIEGLTNLITMFYIGIGLGFVLIVLYSLFLTGLILWSYGTHVRILLILFSFIGICSIGASCANSILQTKLMADAILEVLNKKET